MPEDNGVEEVVVEEKAKTPEVTTL